MKRYKIYSSQVFHSLVIYFPIKVNLERNYESYVNEDIKELISAMNTSGIYQTIFRSGVIWVLDRNKTNRRKNVKSG